MSKTGTTDSYGSYRFPAYRLSDKKRNTVHALALAINEIKNAISVYFNEHLEEFMWREFMSTKGECGYGSVSSMTFQKFVHNGFDEMFKSIQYSKNSFYKSIADDILNNYSLKWENTVQNIRFYIITEWKPIFYKKSTKTHKKGDLKNIEIKKKQTPLSQTMMYLARYGNPHTVVNLHKKLDNKKLKEDDRKFFTQILSHIDKFGWDRLYGLAMRKRQRTIGHYFAEPIVYEKLTVRGRCRKMNIIDFNSKSSVVDAFINLSGISDDYKNFYIPVKYSKAFFGDINKFNEQHNEFMYVMTFDPVTKNPTVILQKKMERDYVILSEEDDECIEKIKALDVNVKHNLLMDSDGHSYDIPRDVVFNYLKEIYKTYELHKKDKHYHVGKKRQRKINALSKKVVHLEQDLVAQICKDYQKEGTTHIVLEDLTNQFGKCFIKKTIKKLEDIIDEDEKKELEIEVNHALITKFLKTSSIKDEFIHIATKYGIAVSLVQAAYTSQTCPICGHIHKNNRQCQKNFVCQNCGHSDNADHNAAVNIKNRVVRAVLRPLLQKNSDDRTFRPSKLYTTKEKVKKFLESVRYDGCSGNGVSDGSSG